MTRKLEKLAILGGPKAVRNDPGDLFKWPIITKEDEDAVLDVLRRGAMSNSEVTQKFEAAYAKWMGLKYALGYCNGTAALLGAMWACGLRVGDEIICPSLSYWASALPAFSLGASVVFADVDAQTLCIDPKGIERHVGPRTKAIMAVHQFGHPCDMDAILRLARRRKLKVIEDASHAHGGLYKGRMVGTFGDVGCFSLMSGKGLPAGEAGMIVTNNRLIWERAVAFGFYERTGQSRYAKAARPSGGDGRTITDPELVKFAGLPLGGYKHRMNQICAAMGLAQLKRYPRRMAEIQKAMNYFWDRLEGCPGVRPHRVKGPGRSTMGGWYSPMGLYVPEELGGLSVDKFCQAARAEGCPCNPLFTFPLHMHPLFREADVYGHGKPTAIAFAHRDVRARPGSLPVAEAARSRVFMVPWFKHCRKRAIDQYVAAIRKVAGRAGDLVSAAPRG